MNVRDIQTKVDVLVDNLDKLRALPTESYETFVSDFRNTSAALHLLQTSIQALIDIAAYVVSNLGLRAPATSADIIQVLLEARLVSEGKARAYVKMVQFRNRVVHLYNHIDVRVLYGIVTAEPGDMRELLGLLLDTIEANPD